MTAKKKTSLLKRIWDGLFRSGRPVYMEDRSATSQKAKRRHKQAVKAQHKPAKKAKTVAVAPVELTPDQPAYWGYVDAKGHVRLKDNDQILGKSSRSKKAALAEFASRFTEQQARLERLENLEGTEALERENRQALEALSEDVKRRPGLGDVAQLTSRLAALQASYDDAAQHLKTQRQTLLDALGALNQEAKFQDVSAALDDLETRWQALVATGSPEEAPLMLRFERSVKAIRQLQSQVDGSQDALAEEGAALLAELEEQIENSAWQSAKALLGKKAARRALIERALGEEIRDRFSKLDQVIDVNLDEEARKTTAAKEEADRQRHAILEALAQFIDMQGWRAEPSGFSAIKQDWQALQADAALANSAQELLFAQESARLQDALSAERSARAERKQEAERSRQDLLESLDSWLRQAQVAQGPKDWSAIDDGLAGIKQAWAALDLAASKAEQDALNSGLQALSQARQDYYDSQDKGREQALEKKRILIDDVTKFSPSLGSKELRQHLSESLESWKAAGSAGREHEDALWEAYNQARDTVRQEIDRLRGVEAVEAAERLSAAFAAKKDRQAQLENLIMVDELLNESKPSKSLQKQIEKKKSQIRELQDQMMDIQRRLRDLSRLNAAETAEVAGQDEPQTPEVAQQNGGDAS